MRWTQARAALVVVFLGHATPAAADPAPVDRAPVAEALFRDGRKLMEAGSYADACVKLGESYRIDPRIGTLLNLATCHDLEGRTATAWAEYVRATSEAARAGRSKDEAFGRGNVDRLEPKIPRLVLSAEHPPEGLSVSLDGQRLGVVVLQTSLPIDPGKHRVGATAPGRVSWSTEVDIAPGPSTRTLSIPDLPPAAPEPPARAAPPAATAPAPGPTSGRGGPLVWGLGAVALGAAGVGSYFGLRAFSKNSTASQQCPGDLCTPDGKAADTAGRNAATASDVAFGVAGAAAALTVYFLFFDSPARVALSPQGVRLRGQW